VNWIWLNRAVLIAAHGEQLAEHGGASGMRDKNLFDSAIARPLNLAAYGKPDVADLAAAYGVGLAKNHPFIDGNKRTAFVAVETFLLLNGYVLNATDAECIMTMLAVASGDMDEPAFAGWLRSGITQRD
jgi:death-on-curing protein